MAQVMAVMSSLQGAVLGKPVPAPGVGVGDDHALYQRVSEAGDGELETMPCGATSIQGRRWRIC